MGSNINFWDQDFIGGTLVEYKEGYDWYSKQEFSRGTITKCILNKKKKSAFVITDSLAKWGGEVRVEDYRNGVWYIGSQPYFNVMYRIAPKGVDVGGLV